MTSRRKKDHVIDSIIDYLDCSKYLNDSEIRKFRKELKRLSLDSLKTVLYSFERKNLF